MRRVCSVATVRRAEAGAGVAEPVLMQRAAAALAGLCADLLRTGRGRVRGARVVGLVGSGNNGGDALWALSFLAARGVAATAVGELPRMHAEGAAAARAAGVRFLDWADAHVGAACAGADLALDGIVGIGGSGGLREPSASVVRELMWAGVPIVAVDVPSGVDSDTGEVADGTTAVRAIATACFGVLKPGLVLAPGRDHAGVVTVVEIGLRAADLEPAAMALELADLAVAPPDPGTHKYRRGVVGVTAGSPQYPGAAVLAVGGARRAGAGMVTVGCGDARGTDGTAALAADRADRAAAPQGVTNPVAALVASHYPDVVLTDARPVDARCVGPGLGGGAEAVEATMRALEDSAALVVDASGLDALGTTAGRAALARRRDTGLVTVLTPHAGEFTRLGHDVSGGTLQSAQRAASDLGCVLVLKGPATVVAASGGTAFIDTFGSAALATAGTGDVLAGLLAGMLAGAVAGTRAQADRPPTNDEVALVAARAVGLHGLAGRLAAARVNQPTAADVLAELPQALAAAATAD